VRWITLQKMQSASRSEIKRRPFAERRCESYSDLIRAIDERRRDLGIPLLELDEISGVQEGYSAKIMCLQKTLGPLTFGLVMAALNLEITVQNRKAA
jgi:hypothetical protein